MGFLGEYGDQLGKAGAGIRDGFSEMNDGNLNGFKSVGGGLAALFVLLVVLPFPIWMLVLIRLV